MLMLTRFTLITSLLVCVGCQGPLQMPIESPTVSSVTKAPSQIYMLLQDGQLESAETKLRATLTRHPNRLSARTNLGVLLARTGRESEAESQLLIVLENDSFNCPANVQLGLFELKKLEVLAAEQHLRKCLQANPNYQAALINLGILLEIYKGEYVEALSLYKRHQAGSEKPDRSVQIWIANLNRRLAATIPANQIAEVTP